MTIRRVTPLILALLMLCAGIALWASPVSTLRAEARTVADSDIGKISGEYWVAGADYDGSFYPYKASVSQGENCIKVQRKAGGVWRDNVSSTAPANSDGVRWHCSNFVELSWWIHDNKLAGNTDAIRIVGAAWGYLNLCNSRADCQQT